MESGPFFKIAVERTSLMLEYCLILRPQATILNAKSVKIPAREDTKVVEQRWGSIQDLQ